MFQAFHAPEPETASGTQTRIADLRRTMRTVRIDAYLVPRGDAHQGEYVAPCDERLAWLTGFTGSAGFAAIAASTAALIVDGRYTLQARQQVSADLFEFVTHTPSALEEWLSKNLSEGTIVGFDPWLLTMAQAERLEGALSAKAIKLRPVAANLVDKIWGANRPAQPAEPVVQHPKKFAGRTAAEKLDALRADLNARGAAAVVLTQPDSICWLFNIRGRDIAHTPVMRGFAIVPAKGRATLYTFPDRVTPAARRTLEPIADIEKPERFSIGLANLKAAGGRIELDPQRTPVWIAKKLRSTQVSKRPDPCLLPKAIKTPVEQEGARTAHHRDGLAMARFLAWLDQEAPQGTVDEISAAQRLEAFRAETGELREISFDTISGSGPNGAIVHYRVTEASNRRLKKGELYLVDSGGQYADGTTDITRTLAIGRPTRDMRRHYTLVLKGHIAIATARFPIGTRGVDLDSLARRALWQSGLDYDHGTGHGVGSYLSVHEGPQSISKRGMSELRPGMIISNEPGFYKENAYGIRIENLVLVEDASVPPGGDRQMLSFETLTLAPFDARLIDVVLLTPEERDWLNGYHADVYKSLAEGLDRATKAWLRAACAKV